MTNWNNTSKNTTEFIKTSPYFWISSDGEFIVTDSGDSIIFSEESIYGTNYSGSSKNQTSYSGTSKNQTAFVQSSKNTTDYNEYVGIIYNSDNIYDLDQEYNGFDSSFATTMYARSAKNQTNFSQSSKNTTAYSSVSKNQTNYDESSAVKLGDLTVALSSLTVTLLGGLNTKDTSDTDFSGEIKNVTQWS